MELYYARKYIEMGLLLGVTLSSRWFFIILDIERILWGKKFVGVGGIKLKVMLMYTRIVLSLIEVYRITVEGEL